MFVRRFPRTEKIMANRPSAPTSATAPDAMTKEADQKNSDLALHAKKHGVGRTATDEPEHRFPVLGIAPSLEVGIMPRDVTTQHEILEQERPRAHEDSHTGIQKHQGQRGQDYDQANSQEPVKSIFWIWRKSECKRGTTSRTPRRELHVQSPEHGDYEGRGVEDGCPVFCEHEIEHRCQRSGPTPLRACAVIFNPVLTNSPKR